MFAIEMLPAAQGDCLLVEWGSREDPHRLLVDGGTAGTWKALRARLDLVPADRRRLELLVVTHVDSDHIAGVLPLLEDRTLGVSYGDVWFNGWRHLPGAKLELGPVQGERLTRLILGRRLAWNAAFDGEALMLPESGPPPCRNLPGGLTVTVLGPGPADLEKLRPVWAAEVRRAGLEPGVPPESLHDGPSDADLVLGGGPLRVDSLARRPFAPDSAVANRTSITLLLAYAGRSLLLTGDAHADVLRAGLERMLAGCGDERVAVDAVKLAHHGSKFNTDAAVLARLRSPRWLVSSNGAYFHHPDPETIARILVAQPDGGVAFHFGYQTEKTTLWADARLQREHGYSAVYPDGGQQGLRVEL